MTDEHNSIVKTSRVPEKVVAQLPHDVAPHSFAPEPPSGYPPAVDRDDDQRVELIQYWRLLRRRQGTLILATCVGVLLALLLTLPQTPVYQAKTSLELLNLNQDFMNMKDVDEVAEESGYNLLTDIQTQIKILQSDTLLDKVVGEIGVHPAEAPDARIPEWRKLLNLPMLAKQNSQDKALSMAAKELKVRASGQTRIIELTVDSTDPKIAANFANRLTQNYIEDNIESRWEMTQKTGDFLTKQIDDMRAKLERSEELMQDYARRNGLVFGEDEKTNVANERLKDLQDELTKAQADRVEKQSRWEMARSASPQTLPDVLNDSTLRLYEEKLTDLRREKAELGEAFTADYSKVKRADAEIAAIQQSLEVKQADILNQIKNEYDSAMRREILLQDDYRQETALVGDQSEKAIQYNILKREVDTNRQLYESMLQHVKEASLAGALRASNIRVVDLAKVPLHPYKPQILLNSLLGLLAGGFFGVAYIVMTEKADRMLQEPSDISLYLGVAELGVIPAESALKRANGKYLYGGTRGHEKGDDLKLTRTLRQIPELITWQQKPSLMAESFRAALTSILFTGQNGSRPRLLAVTSPNPGDGKTTVATNLAIALAETGQSVLLIDGDMRKPRLHTIFDINNAKGLTTILRNGHSNGNKPQIEGEPARGLQEELTEAQANRAEKHSRWKMAEPTSPETLPDELADPAYRLYREKLVGLKREKAVLEESAASDSFQVKRVAEQIVGIQQDLASKHAKIVKHIKDEYDSAVQRENLLQKNKHSDFAWMETIIPGLSVMPAGPGVSGPTNLLYAKHFPAMLRELQESFDMILIDTPPMLTITDARLIGKLANAVLLVVRAGSTTRDAAIAARTRLKEDGIRVLGTIMNDWNPKHSRNGYYGYYDGYYRYYKKSYNSKPTDVANGALE